MSAKKGALADAWDDDWETLADVPFRYLHIATCTDCWQKEEVKPEPAKPAKLSKAERRAQHAQFNRELWESAFVCPAFPPTYTILTVVATARTPSLCSSKPAIHPYSPPSSPPLLFSRASLPPRYSLAMAVWRG